MNIVVDHIQKKFGETPIIKDLSFQVESGQVLGLLGPNGAGKTTTLRMILDILRPDDGSITFEGKKINHHIRNTIGYLPEERGIYQKYSVLDTLMYFGRLKNLSKRKSHVEAVRLLDRFGMIEYLDVPVSHLSKGWQQKLQFLITIIHDPEIIILDEPFWGLDPLNQEMLRKQILQFKEKGKVVLLSTHQLNEAEALCDYFVMIDEGEVVLKGKLEEIRRDFQENMVIIETEENLEDLKKIPQIQKIVVENRRAILHIDKNVSLAPVLQRIVSTVNITKLEVNKPSLNDVFLETIRQRRTEAK